MIQEMKQTARRRQIGEERINAEQKSWMNRIWGL